LARRTNPVLRQCNLSNTHVKGYVFQELYTENTLQTAVIFSDTHCGFEDNKALEVVYEVIEKYQPNQVIHLGDLLDAYGISSFSKDPLRIETLQDEINIAKKLLRTIRTIAPQTKLTLFEGNHEYRLSRVIQNMDNGARELVKLDSFQEAMTWPSLLQLSKVKCKFIPHNKQPFTELIPHLALKHGNVVRKFSGYTARGEFEHYHSSGMSGHTHRLSKYFHTTLGTQYMWVETGCTCSTTPEYTLSPNWQQGFAVVTYTSKELLDIEVIRIQNGKAYFRGEQYGN